MYRYPPCNLMSRSFMMMSLLESSEGASLSTIAKSASIIRFKALNWICMVASPMTLVFLAITFMPFFGSLIGILSPNSFSYSWYFSLLITDLRFAAVSIVTSLKGRQSLLFNWLFIVCRARARSFSWLFQWMNVLFDNVLSTSDAFYLSIHAKSGPVSSSSSSIHLT